MDLFRFNFLYESVASMQVMYTVLTVEPTEYLEYMIKDGLTFYRGRIIHALNSNGLDVTLLFSNGNRQISSRGPE